MYKLLVIIISLIFIFLIMFYWNYIIFNIFPNEKLNQALPQDNSYYIKWKTQNSDMNNYLKQPEFPIWEVSGFKYRIYVEPDNRNDTGQYIQVHKNSKWENLYKFEVEECGKLLVDENYFYCVSSAYRDLVLSKYDKNFTLIKTIKLASGTNNDIKLSAIINGEIVISWLDTKSAKPNLSIFIPVPNSMAIDDRNYTILTALVDSKGLDFKIYK